MSICGEPDGPPTKYGVAIVDVCTGMLACNAILAALNARHGSGRGQKVELSLYESALHMLVNVASNVLVSGRGGGRFGNGHPSIVPYTTYGREGRHDGARHRQRHPVRQMCWRARSSGMGRRSALCHQPRPRRAPSSRRRRNRGSARSRYRRQLARQTEGRRRCRAAASTRSPRRSPIRRRKRAR